MLHAVAADAGTVRGEEGIDTAVERRQLAEDRFLLADDAREIGDVGVNIRVAALVTQREAHDRAVIEVLRKHGVEIVCLAGYMRFLSAAFIDAYRGRILNVHPSLLPAFPGLGAVGQALAYGAKVTGVTVHFVDEGVDTGPIIFQRAIAVDDVTDAGALLERLRPLEHELLPEAVRRIAAGRVAFDAANPRRVVVR